MLKAPSNLMPLRRWCAIPFLFLLGVLLASPAAALPDIVAGKGEGTAGGLANLGVDFAADGRTTALQFHLAFDPGVVSPREVRPGPGLTDPVMSWSQPAAGELIIVVYSPTLAPIAADNATQRLVDLTFAINGKAPVGETPVTISAAALADAEAKLIPPTRLVPGAITIRGSSIIEIPTLGPAGWITLTLLLAISGVAMHRRRGIGRAMLALLLVAGLSIARPAQAGAPGDADNNGFIDANDAAKITAQLLGLSTALGDPDCTRDGLVDVRDIVCALLFNNGAAPSVTVTPAVVTLAPGDIQTFEATVSGTTDTEVTWQATGGTLSGSGNTALYTPPQEAGTYQVIASSNANPNIFGVATVTVVSEPALRFVSDIPLLSSQMTTATLEVEVLGGDGQPIPGAVVDWSSSDPAAVTVTGTGPLTATVSTAGATAGFAEITARYQDLEARATIVVAELDPHTRLLFEGDVIAAAKLDGAPETCERTGTVGAPEVLVPPPGMPQSRLDKLKVGDFYKDAARQFRVVQIQDDGTILIDELLPPAPALQILLTRNARTEALAAGEVLFSVAQAGGTLGRILSVDILPDHVEIIAGLTCIDEIFNELRFEVADPGQSVQLRSHPSDDKQRVEGLATFKSKSGDVQAKLFSSRFNCSPKISPKNISVQSTIDTFNPELSVRPIFKYDMNDEFYLGVGGRFGLEISAGEVELTGGVSAGEECIFEIKEIKLPVITLAKVFDATIDFSFGVGLRASFTVGTPNLTIATPGVKLDAAAMAGICHDVSTINRFGLSAPCQDPGGMGHFSAHEGNLSPPVPFTVRNFSVVGTARLEAFAQLEVGASLNVLHVVEIIGIDFLRFRAGGYGQITMATPLDPREIPYSGPEWEVGPFIEGKLIFKIDDSSVAGQALGKASTFLRLPLKFLASGFTLFQRDFPVLRSGRPELLLAVNGQFSTNNVIDLGQAPSVKLFMKMPTQINGVTVYIPDGIGEFRIARNGGPINSLPLARVFGPAQQVFWVGDWTPTINDLGTDQIFARLEAGAPDFAPFAQAAPLTVQVLSPLFSMPGQVLLQVKPGSGTTASGVLEIANIGTSPLVVTSIASGLVSVPSTNPPTVFPLIISPGSSRNVFLSAQCAPQNPDYLENVTVRFQGLGAAQVTARVACTGVPHQADLRVVKRGPAEAKPGDPIQYRLDVSNVTGNETVVATVTDVVPAQITNVRWSCSTSDPGAACIGFGGTGNNVSQSLKLPPNGLAATILVDGVVSSSVPPGTLLLNEARTTIQTPGVAETNPSDNASNVTTNVGGVAGGQADLGVFKVGPPKLQPGQPAVYTITVTNAGPQAVTNATLIDNVSPLITGITWTCVASGGAVCGTASGSGNNVSEVLTIPPGAIVTVTVNGVLSASASNTTFENVASLALPAGSVDPNPSNNSSIVTTTIGGGNTGPGQTDLAITKTGPASVAVKSPITYSLLVTNAGPETATGAMVGDDVLPLITGVSWTCSAGPGARCNTGGGTGNSVRESVTIPSGASVTIAVTGISPAFEVPAPGLSNSAVVSPAAGALDPNFSNNTSGVFTLVSGGGAFGADLTLTKTGPASVEVSSPLTWTVMVTNKGPQTAANALVSDDVASVVTGVTWTCAASGGATCNTGGGAGNQVRELVTLPAQGSVTLTLHATAPPFALQSPGMNNSAAVTLPPGIADPNPADNQASVQTVITNTTAPAEADLAVAKTGPPSVMPSAPLTYTLMVTNKGPATATNAVVRDSVASVVTGVRWRCTPAGGAACNTGGGSGNAVSELVTIPAGGSVTVTIDGTAPPFEIGGLGLGNTGSVDAPAGTLDGHLADNTASVTTLVTNGGGGGGAGAKTLFVTSQAFASNLGGLAGADVKCLNAASAAGLSGTYKAWLSDSKANAKDRMIASAGPYKLVGGTQVAASFAKLIDCPAPFTGCAIEHAIDQDEFGKPAAGKLVWTGTLPDGKADTSYNQCADWTTDVPAQGAARSGSTGNSNFGWTALGVTNCDTTRLDHHLYCIEQ